MRMRRAVIRGGGSRTCSRDNRTGGSDSDGGLGGDVALAMGSYCRVRHRGRKAGNQVPDEQRENPDA